MDITTILAMTVSAVGGWLGGYLGAYAKKKGENLAIKEGFDDLLTQVRRTTQATEEIKAQVSQGTSVAQSDLEFRKTQLAEFYGPIYAHLKTGEELYRLWRNHKIDEIDEGIKNLFRENNREIIRIITTKAHLIDGDKLPPEFTRFMTSVTIWNLYTEKMGYVPERLDELPEKPFPPEFREAIFAKTEELKRIIDQLHMKYGITGTSR